MLKKEALQPLGKRGAIDGHLGFGSGTAIEHDSSNSATTHPLHLRAPASPLPIHWRIMGLQPLPRRPDGDFVQGKPLPPRAHTAPLPENPAGYAPGECGIHPHYTATGDIPDSIEVRSSRTPTPNPLIFMTLTDGALHARHAQVITGKLPSLLTFQPLRRGACSRTPIRPLPYVNWPAEPFPGVHACIAAWASRDNWGKRKADCGFSHCE